MQTFIYNKRCYESVLLDEYKGTLKCLKSIFLEYDVLAEGPILGSLTG